MPETRNKLLIPLIVAVVAALALAFTVFGLPGNGGDDATAAVGQGAEPSERSSAENALAKLARLDPGDPMAMGEVDAPVVMIAYAEFQCPFCGKFARDTAPTLEKKYVDNGTLRIEWRDFPYMGPESKTASRAGRAAGEQGKFWEFHDAMFADQLPPNSGKLDEKYVEGIAVRLGLDVQKFRSDMSSDRIRTSVDEDFREGQQIGVTGTPSFLINGKPIVGAQPTDVFEKVIEEAAGTS